VTRPRTGKVPIPRPAVRSSHRKARPARNREDGRSNSSARPRTGIRSRVRRTRDTRRATRLQCAQGSSTASPVRASNHTADLMVARRHPAAPASLVPASKASAHRSRVAHSKVDPGRHSSTAVPASRHHRVNLDSMAALGSPVQASPVNRASRG
jgi:hypothetical protein